jgi:hypothetical protein
MPKPTLHAHLAVYLIGFASRPAPGDSRRPEHREIHRLALAKLVAPRATACGRLWESARDELPRASALAIVWKDEQIVGVRAIKRERRKYAADIAKKSGVEFPQRLRD